MAQTAAERWREDLASWAIPQDILDRAPENPWHFPVQLFTSRADVAGREPTPSDRRAVEALPQGGSVLDVGCGAGAASLPLASKASRLTGVDGSSEMLAEFDRRASEAGVASTAVEGRWPDVSGRVPVADVVVCHHVFYNAPDLPQFARALTGHACSRVVAELTGAHPMSNFNELWLRFHGVVRPTRPTADDAEAVLREVGLEPRREDWVAKRRGGFERRGDAVAWVRRLLCLQPDRDPEVAAALEGWLVENEGRVGPPDRPVVTLWWEGMAR
jgi:SAM-dependent methyltransferase